MTASLKQRTRKHWLLRERNPEREEAWLRSARQGDVDAFESLCALWRGPLLHFARSYCKGDRETAEDIVQSSFLALWVKIDQIKDAEHLRPWLYRVARFKSINWLRKHRPNGERRQSLDYAADRGHELPDRRYDPLRRALQVEPENPWHAALHRAIDRLPAIYIAVVRLHYLRRLTSREISVLLSINHTTVKMRLLRARELLRASVPRELRRGP